MKKVSKPGATRESHPDEKPSVSSLCRTAFDAIGELEQLALNGDDKAARGLWSMASLCNSKLAPLLRKPGPLLRLAMERAPACPANLSVNKGKRDELAAELVNLGLGKTCETNAIGKFDHRTPMSHAVAAVYVLCLRPLRKKPNHSGFNLFDGKEGPFPGWAEWRKANASKIPQSLTRDNARAWADLSEPLLKIFWGQRFEEHPDFASYRDSTAWKRKLAEGKKQSTLKGDLVKMWRQSWKSIANP